MNSLKNRSAAIRNVIREDPSLSTNTIRDIVRETYGLEVSNSHISNIAGPYMDRVRKGKAGKTRLEAAENYLNTCGTLREAVTNLHIIDEKKRQ